MHSTETLRETATKFRAMAANAERQTAARLIDLAEAYEEEAQRLASRNISYAKTGEEE